LSLFGALFHRQRNVALICHHPDLFDRKAPKQNCYNPLIQGVHLELARIYFRSELEQFIEPNGRDWWVEAVRTR
jgi:hypothetical protein